MIPTGCYNIPAYPALRPTQSSVEVQGPLPLRRQEGSWESGHHWPLHPPLLHLKELRVQGVHHFCSPQIHSPLLLPLWTVFNFSMCSSSFLLSTDTQFPSPPFSSSWAKTLNGVSVLEVDISGSWHINRDRFDILGTANSVGTVLDSSLAWIHSHGTWGRIWSILLQLYSKSGKSNLCCMILQFGQCNHWGLTTRSAVSAALQHSIQTDGTNSHWVQWSRLNWLQLYILTWQTA